ncbi:CHAT domain-containing protein [Nonomuraea sp. NPDC050404]|uniref:CHAT domain-containing protein n=1 Tax=Nonomuraea sp. NPDC050404 TaxID=3155783 RepID=UPI0034017074
MTDPAGALAARIERFEQAADPELIWDPAALSEAEQAMRACAGDRGDAGTWRLIGMLHLARYRLDQHTTQDAAVAGAFFAAVAVLDPGRLPEKLRGSKVPPGESADTWAGLVEEVFRHVDPAAYRHVGLLIQALIRRAMTHPTTEVCDRLGQFLLQESMRATDPAWAPGALGLLGAGMVRLYGLTGERDVIDDAVHVLLRAALGGDGAHVGELAAALGLAAPDDEELVRAYLAAAESPPAGQDRSRSLLALADLTRARAAASYDDGDLLAFIRVGQCALDFWHEQWAHPGVLAPYASGLIEWYVVTGDERSLEAGAEMLEALRVTPDETARGLGTDPVVRLGLLGERRWRRYGVTGAPADLDVAVAALRETVERAPAGHPDRPRHLSGLASALLRRAVVTGGDPAEPIAAARAALAVQGERGPARAATLLLLGRALSLDLTQTTDSMAAPDTTAETTAAETVVATAAEVIAAAIATEAVVALREALEIGERADLRVEAYGLVAEVLCRRATAVTTATDGDRRAVDLREAVLSARQGAELALKSSHGQAPAQRILCRTLLARYSAQGDPRDLTEALSLAGEADTALLPELSVALDVPAVVDEQLARVATELALRLPDEEVTLKLLRVAERGGEDRPGEFLLGVALRLAELGRADTAGSLLERAARAFLTEGAPSRAAYTLARLAAVREELGEIERALETYGRSAAVYHDLGEPGQEALQVTAMGLVHLRNGDPARAVEHHLRAIALCEDAGLADGEAEHQEHAAEAYLAAGDPAAAVACAARARGLRMALGETELAALALVPAARAAVDQGDLTAAAERMAACAIELEAAGAWEEACRRLDAHALALAVRGHHRQAAACEARLVEIVRRRGRRREPADEWYRIGQRRRARGDTDGAVAAFELAGQEYESIGHEDGSGAVRYNLGVLAYADGDFARGLEVFGAAAETFAGLLAPGKEAAALTLRASCLTALDRVDEALTDLDRALELAAAEGDLDALLTATLGRAAADVALGELRAAGERLYSALGLAAGDAFKEAVVRDRLADLAARTGDLGARVEALEAAMAGFRESGQNRLAALASIKLGFALEARGEFSRARTALESGLTGTTTISDPEPAFTTTAPKPEPRFTGTATTPDAEPALTGSVGSERAVAEELRSAGASFEMVAAMAGGLDVEALSRLAAIQLTLGDLTRGRATLSRAVASLRAGGARGEELARLEGWLRLEEAEASGDLRTARTLAEQALGPQAPGSQAPFGQAPGARTPAGPAPEARRVRTPAGPAPEARTPLGTAADRSYLLAKLSAICRTLDDLPAAYEHAARGYELRDDRMIEHLRNLGAAATALGRAEEAAGQLARAVELARDAPTALPAQLVQSLCLLAAALTDLGRWSEAARAYEEGLALTEAPLWRALRAPLLSGRATLHLRLGELDEAATRYREAISINEELDRHDDLAASYADLGLVHELRGEPAEARPLVERALDLERAHGHGRGTVPALIALARLEPENAPAHLAEALTLARQIGFRAGEAIALSRLGALALTTAPHAHAHQQLTTAIDLLAELGHDPELAEACHHRSIAAEELGDLPAALADAERACALGREDTRDRTIRLAVRLGLGMTAWTHAEHAELAWLTTHLAPEHPAAFHDTVPATFHDTVPAARHDTVPADLLEAEQRGRAAVRTLMTATRNTRDPEQAALLVRRARAARSDLETVWRHMEPMAPEYAALRRGLPPTRAELDTLVAPPDGGARAVLGFHVGADTVTVFAHRTGWPEPRAFPTTVGHDLLTDFLSTLNGRRPDLLDIEARRRRAGLWRSLADLLLSDVLTALGNGIDQLHLLPHAELHRVPLHALAPSGRPLLERFPIAYAPSAAVLTRLTRRPHTRGGGSLVLGHTQDLAARPVVEGEAQDVAALLGSPARIAANATSDLLPGSWDVVHLACHGVYDNADPFASGIRLADGLLTARHLMTTNLTANLLLLTTHEPADSPAHDPAHEPAHEPAHGLAHEPTHGFAHDPAHQAAPEPTQESAAPREGDGVAAMEHGLLHAGARSAVLTLWPVSPEITRALVRDLHTRLRDGATPAHALRAAVLELRELYGSAEPDLWASYVLIGLAGGDPPTHFESGVTVTSTR